MSVAAKRTITFSTLVIASLSIVVAAGSVGTTALGRKKEKIYCPGN